jgi:hypothetical protein
LGVFRPIKTTEGSYRISYMISSSLRKLLNGTELEEKKPLRGLAEKKTETIIPDKLETNEETTEEKESKIKPPGSNRITSKVGDVIIPPDDDDNNNFGPKLARFALVAIILVVVCVAGYFAYSFFVPGNNKGEDERPILTAKENRIDLTELAERSYGNRAFWIYIYYANRDKLSSPVNIPEGVDITIPDLKEEYNINLNDTADIRLAIEQANAMSGIILE